MSNTSFCLSFKILYNGGNMDFKKETLKELGVYELRELARMLGVPSPTTKRREELEEDIITYSQLSNKK